ncbi:Osmolarity sensor protein EnvZ [Meiothermus luteus]|jgi:signal transduction histidine kinase|uniref:Signal transduction histidine-protein kinase/phosphatase MprB n=1 Tax=Meiothermus luteus TaxID=2026184 RepID=A0A399EHD8_9DEIN|nr:ATP-binding protein [Meiothermus luteus]RIH82963.1 Osmolarity sensor protein EnvZ [Meiothermus luteus]RMH58641.1 MAG: two-component sensor histidine kinase [Deinococcota bacterium]
MPLKRQLAWVIGLLAFVPNLVVVLPFLFSSEGPFGLGRVFLLLWLLALAGLAALAGYGLASALLRSVDELTRSLRYLRGSGRTLAELSLPTPKEPPPPEIAQLREGFEELLAYLRELLEAREATYAALTHDLKTPLLAALRSLEYLEEADRIGPVRRKELLRTLRDELYRSYLLVENLLVASRLETRRVQPEALNLRSILEDFRLRYAPQAAQRGLRIEIEGAGQARGERLLLERALANLVDNALRHARSRVVLRAGEGWLEVEDDGPGLPDSLEVLSQPFRSQRLRGVRAGSAGLGLYVARRVAEAHGGRLENLGTPGQGSRLRIWIEPMRP